ncbi:MAG: ABC transporter permease subunit [bacterium]
MDFRKVMLIVKKDILESSSTILPFVSMFVALLFLTIFFVSAIYAFFQAAFVAVSFPSFARNFNVNDMIVTPYMGFVAFLSVLIIPIIASKSFAQERKLKTIELLFTYPFKEIELVIGKMISTFLMYLMFLTFAMIYIIFFVVVYTVINKGTLDLGVIATGFLGLILIGALIVSMSVFVSTLTDEFFVAMLISLFLVLTFWLIGFTGDFTNPTYKNIVKAISISTNFENLSKGVIDLKNIAYFIISIVLFTYLSIFSLTENKG